MSNQFAPVVGPQACTIDLFFKMLSDALERHPGGLPDKELLAVFDDHQAVTGFQLPAGLQRSLDRLEGDSQKTDVSHRPQLQIVSGDRS